MPIDNPKDHPSQWTVYTPAYKYDQPMLDRMYAENMLQASVDQGEAYNLCMTCQKQTPLGQYVHNCTYGNKLGQVHPDMRPEYLNNSPWWEITPSPVSSGENSPELYSSTPINGPVKWTTSAQGNVYLTDATDDEVPDINSSSEMTPNSPRFDRFCDTILNSSDLADYLPKPWFNDEDWNEYVNYWLSP
jgi:hypothetical protein